MLDKLLEENEFLAVYFCKYYGRNISAWIDELEQEVVLYYLFKVAKNYPLAVTLTLTEFFLIQYDDHMSRFLLTRSVLIWIAGRLFHFFMVQARTVVSIFKRFDTIIFIKNGHWIAKILKHSVLIKKD